MNDTTECSVLPEHISYVVNVRHLPLSERVQKKTWESYFLLTPTQALASLLGG